MRVSAKKSPFTCMFYLKYRKVHIIVLDNLIMFCKIVLTLHVWESSCSVSQPDGNLRKMLVINRTVVNCDVERGQPALHTG